MYGAGYGAAPMAPGYGAPMPGAMPAAPMPGMMGPGYGAPMPGAPMPGMMPGAPMPGAPMAMAGGFPTGYPIFRGQMTANMYYKPIWTPKREAKLQRAWYEIARDGAITYNEILRLLAVFHYHVSPYEAQWFFNTLDCNHDGRIDFAEVRAAMQQFVMTYPRVRNTNKMFKMKPWYQMGYNWRAHPGFPTQYGNLWRF